MKKRPSTPWFEHLFSRRSDFFNNLAIFVWTEWTEDHKNRCLSSSINSVGFHFHEGVDKIKENIKNTKIENLKMGRKSMAGKPRVPVKFGQKF